MSSSLLTGHFQVSYFESIINQTKTHVHKMFSFPVLSFYVSVSVRAENSYKQGDNKPANAHYSVIEYVSYELVADARVSGTYQQDHQTLAAISSSGSYA
jgi:hypothetical protein